MAHHYAGLPNSVPARNVACIYTRMAADLRAVLDRNHGDGRCADGDRGVLGAEGHVTAATLRNGFEARLARHGEPRGKPAGRQRFVVG